MAAPTQEQLDNLAAGRAKRLDPEARAQRKADKERLAAVSAASFTDALPPDDKAPKPQADKSPKKTGGRPAGYSPKAAGLVKIKNGLTMMFTMGGMAVSLIDTYDGDVVAKNAEFLAEHWTLVAEQSPRVRKVLEAMLEGSAIGNAVMASCMVALPIAAHHNMVSQGLVDMASTMGVDVPPDSPAGRPVASRATAGTPPPQAQAPAGGGGSIHPLDGRPVPDQSFEDVTLPGYGGPPGPRVA